jgi:hypothetical protein
MYRFGRGRTLLFQDTLLVLIPVATVSKTWVYGRSFVGIGDSNPVGGSLVSVVCRQEEVFGWG